MTLWLPDLSPRRGPRYLAIADAIAEAVRLGTLKGGDQLPPHREMAYHLGVTVGTVTRGYREAERRGLLTGEVGRGTFVRDTRSDPAAQVFQRRADDRGLLDLGINQPHWRVADQALLATIGELSRSEPLAEWLTATTGDFGIDPHRDAAVKIVARNGLVANREQTLITLGVQSALYVALSTMLQPDETVLTEVLTYPILKILAAHLNLRLKGVAIDREGIIPESLENLCRSRQPAALVVTPTLHNPTTATMSIERRRRIAEIAREYDLALIEDDICGLLLEHRPPPIATLVPERTWYMTSGSKCGGSDLRHGVLVVPPGMAERAGLAIRAASWFVPPLTTEIATRWFTDGTMDRLIAWQRQELAARHQLAHDLLPCPFTSDPAALNLWLPLPSPWRAESFTAEARRRGVIVVPAEAFVVGREHPPHAVRISLCAEPDRGEVARGLTILAEALQSQTNLSSVVC